MRVTIAHSITAEVIEEKQLSVCPAWIFDGASVVLGFYNSMDEYEQHLLSTVGSDDWYGISGSDAFRFGKTDMLLQSAWLYLPNHNSDFRHAYTVWRNHPVTYGILRLEEVQSFHCFVGAMRWFDPAGEALIAFQPEALSNTDQRLRLRIAQDFDLLFVDHMLCGWILLSPVRYLSDLWSMRQRQPSAEALHSIISDYLHLVGMPTVEQLEDGDPAMVPPLLRLHKQLITACPDSQQRHIVRGAIEQALNLFYPDVLLE